MRCIMAGRYLSWYIALGLSIASSIIYAEGGGLRFSPQRVVIEGRQHTASLSLSNNGKASASYRVELVDMLYQDDGTVVEAKDLPAGYPSARSLVRFSPRQVRLEPGETQTIRVLIRTGQNLPDGEYRVHAKLAELPDVSKITNPATPKGNLLSGTVGISQAVALPIIVRWGQTAAQGSIQSITIVPGKTTALDLKLGRTGNRSLYTDLILRTADGAEVTRVNGIALPVPNPWRRFLFNVPKLTPAQLKSGNYRLELLNRDAGGAVLDSQIVNSSN